MQEPKKIRAELLQVKAKIEELFNEMSIADIEEFCHLSISDEDKDNPEKVKSFMVDAKDKLEEMSMIDLEKGLDWLIEIEYEGLGKNIEELPEAIQMKILEQFSDEMRNYNSLEEKLERLKAICDENLMLFDAKGNLISEKI